MLCVIGIAKKATQPVNICKNEVGNIGKGCRTKGIGTLRQIDVTSCILLGQLTVSVPYVRSVIIVLQTLHQSVGPLCERHRLWLQTYGLHSNRTTVIDLHLSFLTFLCSDDDYTIGSTTTIDGCRTVLQEVNAFNIIGIDGTHVTSHAIDDDQRTT